MSDESFRVLVVDDSEDVADSLAMVFGLRGLQVTKAYDAETALDLARQQKPRAVVLDLVLPGMDGYALAETLRAEPGLRDTLLVAYTGDSSEAARTRCAAAGIDIYVLKPVDPTQLVELVTRSTSPHTQGERRLRLVGLNT